MQEQSTITISETRTAIEPDGASVAKTTEAKSGESACRPPHFWAEYRARRKERVPRAQLRQAVALAGEGFCRRALAGEVPFGRACAEEARGTRGELREALLRLAIAGGRPVAREQARGRVGELVERARAMSVEEPQLEAALATVGAERVERVLCGRVGFRRAATFEAALHADEQGRSQAWLAIAASDAHRVRAALRRKGGARTAQAHQPGPAEPARAGAELVASSGRAHGLSPFGAELARAISTAS
jgi:hypothetical protein